MGAIRPVLRIPGRIRQWEKIDKEKLTESGVGEKDAHP
jgi:hypothetical protein